MMKRLLIAAAFLLASAPLYAQQISVDRTRYCNDLSKWTSVARTQVTARNDAKSMDPYKCGPIPAPPPVPVNCVVSAWSAFSAWTPLNATTEQRTQTRTVLTPASNGGTPCPSLTNTETRPIVVVLPPPPPPPPPPTPDPVPPPPAPDPTPAPVGAGAFFISPFGLDTNAGTQIAPFKTFAKAFTVVKPSGELVLLDGTYTAATTGLLSDLPNAIIPNGTAAAHTRIHALNFGKVFQMGSLWLGRSSVKRSYVDIEGIVFDGGTAGPGVTLYNTSFDTLRQVGSHGSPNNDGAAAFDVGTNDGEWGNTDNLIEDSFGWGNARAIADNYYEANRNTWRRVLLRRDGCKIGDGNNGCSTDPNITFTVYDSQNVTVENMIILDGILTDSRTGYADFATAQHDPGPKNGGNKWLGTLSLGSPDHSYYFESDGTGPQPEVTAQDVIGWASKENMALQPSGALVANRVTTTDSSPDFIGSSVTKSSVVVNASPTNHVGGASLLFRYQNGVLTQTPLWPWPNEATIQSVMCVGTSVRGFCFDTQGLSHYIWSKLSSQGLPY